MTHFHFKDMHILGLYRTLRHKSQQLKDIIQ